MKEAVSDQKCLFQTSFPLSDRLKIVTKGFKAQTTVVELVYGGMVNLPYLPSVDSMNELFHFPTDAAQSFFRKLTNTLWAAILKL